jgi:hypothetical protein
MLPEEVTAMVRLNELGLGTKRMIARELQMQPDDGETLSRAISPASRERGCGYVRIWRASKGSW